MEARKRTPKAMPEVKRTREYSLFQNATRLAATAAGLKSPCRKYPVIVPQPPTKTPKCRQKTDNCRRSASSSPFRGGIQGLQIAAYKGLIMRPRTWGRSVANARRGRLGVFCYVRC